MVVPLRQIVGLTLTLVLLSACASESALEQDEKAEEPSETTAAEPSPTDVDGQSPIVEMPPALGTRGCESSGSLSASQRTARLDLQRAVMERVLDSTVPAPCQVVSLFHSINMFPASMIILPTGEVAQSGQSGSIVIYDPTNQGQAPEVIEAHDGNHVLAFMDDGRIISGGLVDGLVKVWDRSDPDSPVILSGHNGKILSLVALSGDRVAATGEGGTISLWNVNDGGDPQQLTSHDGKVLALAGRGDNQLLSIGDDAVVRIWDLSTLMPVDVIPVNGGGLITSLEDGRIAVGDREVIRLIDIGASGTETELIADAGFVQSMAVQSDGALISAHSDGSSIVWDVSTATASLEVATHRHLIPGFDLVVPYGPAGVMTYDGLSGEIAIWDFLLEDSLVTSSEHDSPLTQLEVVGDRQIVSGDGDGGMRVWDLGDPSSPVVLSGHDRIVVGLDQGPNGQFLSASLDRTVRIWDLASLDQPIRTLPQDDLPVGATFLNDGRVGAITERKLTVWDEDNLEIEQYDFGRLEGLGALDDGRIVFGDWAELTIADLTSLRPDQRIDDASVQDAEIVVGPAGRIVSGNVDYEVRVWEPPYDSPPITLIGHEGKAITFAVLDDGRVVSADERGRLIAWDLATATPSLVLEFERRIESVVSGPDNTLFVTVGRGWVRLDMAVSGNG